MSGFRVRIRRKGNGFGSRGADPPKAKSGGEDGEPSPKRAGDGGGVPEGESFERDLE